MPHADIVKTERQEKADAILRQAQSGQRVTESDLSWALWSFEVDQQHDSAEELLVITQN